jgi:hypothetical protein
MRLYFDSWADVLDHFTKIEKVKNENVEMFLPDAKLADAAACC